MRVVVAESTRNEAANIGFGPWMSGAVDHGTSSIK